MNASIAIDGRITVDNAGEMRVALRPALRKNPPNSGWIFPACRIPTLPGWPLVEAFRMANTEATRLVLVGIQGQPQYTGRHGFELKRLAPSR